MFPDLGRGAGEHFFPDISAIYPMNKRIYSLLLTPYIILALVLANSASAVAQLHPVMREVREVRVINGETSDTIDEIEVFNIFTENAPKTYNVSGAPRFAIVGKEKMFYLGIGGVVKATASYDFGHPIDNGFDFTTSNIPMHIQKGNEGLVHFNAQSSALNINFVAMPGTANQIGVYLDANLTSGKDYGFRLQYAYIKYRGITAGYNYSLFSDMAAAPASIDNEGPPGFTAIPHGVVDYAYNINKHWSVAAGLETPAYSVTTSDETYTVNQRVPDIPFYAQYAWDGGNSWVRASGMIRNLLYHDMVSDRNHNALGWGVKLSGSMGLSSWVTAYYQAAYGKGISSYFQDTYRGGLDMMPDASEPGKLSTVEAWGGYIGLQFNISPKVFATTTYSHERNYAKRYDGGAVAWGEQYKYAQYALANVIWKITPIVHTGVEYIYGRRVNHSGEGAHDNRIQAMLRIAF